MTSTPLIRVLPAALALAIAVAVLPVAAASATPNPTQTTAVAARACVASMQLYPLDDDVHLALAVRQEAWREAALGRVTGMTDETDWAATPGQIAALQIALTWMSAASVRDLSTLGDDDLRSAEDDLVWAVGNLPDRRLGKVLVLPLADRTATIAGLRAGTRTSADPDADTRPDVAENALVRFQRRLHVAIRSLPIAFREDLRDLRAWKSVHSLGTAGALLDWTQQQGERGQELFGTWSGAGAIYAAALRSVVAGTAAANSYAGVLDGCVRTLRTGSDDNGLTVKRSRTLARADIALRLDPDGAIRVAPESTAKAKTPTTVRSPAAVKFPTKAKSTAKARATPVPTPTPTPNPTASTCPGTDSTSRTRSAAAFCSATD